MQPVQPHPGLFVILLSTPGFIPVIQIQALSLFISNSNPLLLLQSRQFALAYFYKKNQRLYR